MAHGSDSSEHSIRELPTKKRLHGSHVIGANKLIEMLRSKCHKLNAPGVAGHSRGDHRKKTRLSQ